MNREELEKEIREIIDWNVGGSYVKKQTCAEEIIKLFSPTESGWTEGDPTAEGEYLGIRYFDSINEFGRPTVVEFVFDQNGNGVWKDRTGYGVIIDYYLPLPQNPKR